MTEAKWKFGVGGLWGGAVYDFVKSHCVSIIASRPNGTLDIGVMSDLFVRVDEHKQDSNEAFTTGAAYTR